MSLAMGSQLVAQQRWGLQAGLRPPRHGCLEPCTHPEPLLWWRPQVLTHVLQGLRGQPGSLPARAAGAAAAADSDHPGAGGCRRRRSSPAPVWCGGRGPAGVGPRR